MNWNQNIALFVPGKGNVFLRLSFCEFKLISFFMVYRYNSMKNDKLVSLSFLKYVKPCEYFQVSIEEEKAQAKNNLSVKSSEM